MFIFLGIHLVGFDFLAQSRNVRRPDSSATQLLTVKGVVESYGKALGLLVDLTRSNY
jgi:hypothetical protein